MSELSLQPMSAGAGPEYHRVFSTSVDLPERFVLQAFERLKSDLNVCLPQAVLSACKTRGQSEELEVGDEIELQYFFRSRSPLRISHVDRHSFVMQTLSGNLEAGEVRVSLKQDGPERLRLEVETLARSRDRLMDFIYDKIPFARIVQAVLWVEFCENFVVLAAELAQAPKPIMRVQSTTERKFDGEKWETLDRDLGC